MSDKKQILGLSMANEPEKLEASAVVFDCDGLLVDSEAVWLDLIQQWMDTQQPALRLSLDEFHGLTVVDTARLLYRFTGDRYQSANVIEDEITQRYSDLLARGVPLMPGAKGLLKQLYGKVPIALASNGLRRDVLAMLEANGLTSFFNAICTLEDVKEGKPQPEIYLLACRLLSVVPEQAVAFEDSPTGVRAAVAAGLSVVGVSSKPEVKLPSDFRISSLAQVSL